MVAAARQILVERLREGHPVRLDGGIVTDKRESMEELDGAANKPLGRARSLGCARQVFVVPTEQRRDGGRITPAQVGR